MKLRNQKDPNENGSIKTALFAQLIGERRVEVRGAVCLNASLEITASTAASVGSKRDRNHLFDQDSFLLRALGATEYTLLVPAGVGRLNAIKPHTPAAIGTQRLFSNRPLKCLK
jgi:hypothetical protein